jgi:Na+/phosphate symporter
MLFPLIAGALAGLGIFFLGMHIASENIRDLITPRIQEKIIRWTRRDLFGSIWGSIIGFISQETSVVTFIFANLCTNKFISLRRALPIINWNNPGGCILVYFVFLDVDPFIMIAVGILATLLILGLFAHYQTHIKFFLGLCLLLYGLIIINQYITQIIEMPWVKDSLIRIIEFSGLTIFLMGGVVAFFAQAFIVYVLTAQFVQANIMDFDQAFLMVGGVHFGLALNTYLLFSTFRGKARQVMLFQVFFDVLTGILVLLLYFFQIAIGFPVIQNLLGFFSDQFSFQIVTLFLLANITVALLLNLFHDAELKFISMIAKKPDESVKLLENPQFVTTHLFMNPSSATLTYFKEYISIATYLLTYLRVSKGCAARKAVNFDLDAYHKKFTILFGKIKKILLDLICSSSTAEVIQELDWISKSLELLIQLEENLYVKSSYLQKTYSQDISVDAQTLTLKLLEAEDIILFVLQDVLKDPHAENVKLLELMTHPRTDLLEQILEKFFHSIDSKGEKNASLAMFLMSLFERDAALLHPFAEHLKDELARRSVKEEFLATL